MMLGDYLAEAARKKHLYGAHDCCTFPADWCILNGWPDPMADWRGGYIDASAADGGLLPLFASGMFGAGIPATKTFIEGDVGVVSIFGQEAGAIFTGRRWGLVAPRGLAFASLGAESILKAWRVVRG